MALIRKRKTQPDETPEAVQELFDRQHRTRIDQSFRKARKKLILFGNLCAAVLILSAYFLMPSSRIRDIKVEGTYYLSDQYVKDLAKISTSGYYYLTVPMLVESRIKDDPFISSCSVTLENSNIIRIRISEKQPVGYRYNESPVIIFSDGTTGDLKSDYLDVISRIPMITGFDGDEPTRLLAKAFTGIERSVIEEMSEVTQFSLSYDDQAIRVLMRTGGYFICNYYTLEKIRYYNEIYPKIPDKSKCIYAADSGNTAFAKDCPWSKAPVVTEYWTDEEGKLILNEKGEQIIKHYYKLKDGSDALDGKGNRIPIPIDEKGNEVIDENFDENYEKGAYSSGSLENPEDSSAAQPYTSSNA